ncbi:MAG: band 7 protein [Gammaproteobacteria bacterium]|nr:band 7 protein [Gammaproteobacteria bacterium]
MDHTQRAITKQTEAERQKRAKIISSDVNFYPKKLVDAPDRLLSHPMASQLRNLQMLIEIVIEKVRQLFFPHKSWNKQGYLTVSCREKEC